MSESKAHMIERAVRFLALLGGIALMGLMCLIVYSVFMRRVFNAPPLGSYDIAEVTLIPIVFFSLAYTSLTKGHIAVDLISSLASPIVVRWSDTIIGFICAVSIGALTWESIRLTGYTAENAEVTQMIEIPYLPFVIIMVIGSAMFTIVLLMQTYRSFKGIEEPTNHE